jgi:serine/threonine protein kinase/Tfp pilus assembly protein PilF
VPEESGINLENGETASVTRTLEGAAAAAGDVVGPYHLLQMIGQGGMGEVWLAEQQYPVRRRVAIKLIKVGMDTREVVARFESERQALALMDHPAIAKVFDAGSTPQGRPYFVMEYVAGVPITTYCDKHKLTTDERVELFTLVCEGVQHAHQKAIIHRDLKPSNILVVEIDGKPAPRIIDFGVAKATARLSADTAYTRVGTVVGTLGYMSPEQADSGGEDIDTRSDVYSLGVVFYELLVGVLPLDFNKVAFDEVLRRLREEDTPRPSTKLRTLAVTSGLTAQNRGADAGMLVRQLCGDLDAIALKALEKDRSRRYATPMEFAADLGRYLRHEPVLAHTPGKAYQLRKLVRRNRVLVTSGAAILLTLIAATVVSTREAVRAIRSERNAAASLKQSQQEAAEAQAVNAFLQEMLQSADPRAASKADPDKGRDVTVAHVLDEAVRRLDAGSLHNQPLVEAAARESLGTTFSGLGRYPEAEREYRAALALRRSAPGGHDADLASSEANLAEQLTFEDKLPEAETLQRDALRLRTKVFGPDDPAVSGSLGDLAIMARREGKLQEAETLVRQALAIDLKSHRVEDASIDENNLGVILRLEKRPAEAEAMLRQSLAIHMQASGPENASTALTMNQLSYALHDEGKLAEAEEYARKSLATSRRTEGNEHPDVAVGLNRLATLLRDEGKLDESESMFRQALAVAQHAWGADQTDTAKIETNLGDLLAKRGKLAEAERLLREGLRSREKVLPPGHPDIFDSDVKLGGVLAQEGRFEAAEPLLLSAYHGLDDGSAGHAESKRLALSKIVEMYTAWSRKEPNAGKTKLAEAWKTRQSEPQ